jgi:hypothetical protein
MSEKNFNNLVKALNSFLRTETYTLDEFVSIAEKHLNKKLIPSDYGVETLNEIAYKLNDNAYIELKMSESQTLLINKYVPKPVIPVKSTFQSLSNRMSAQVSEKTVTIGCFPQFRNRISRKRSSQLKLTLATTVSNQRPQPKNSAKNTSRRTSRTMTAWNRSKCSSMWT